MVAHITGKTVQQFVKEIGDQHDVLAGTVIATSAAQAVALGEACMQISLDHQVDTLDWQDVTARIEEMVQLKTKLLEWADREASLIAEIENRSSDEVPPKEDVETLFETPTEVARLCLEAIFALQDFRPLALDRLTENLAIAVRLLLGGAETALLLLRANLARWDTSGLAESYKPVLAELGNQVDKIRGANPD